MTLDTTLRLADPDGTFAALTRAYRDLSEGQARAFDARLILLLVNHIGDEAVVREAIAMPATGWCRATSSATSTRCPDARTGDRLGLEKKPGTSSLTTPAAFFGVAPNPTRALPWTHQGPEALGNPGIFTRSGQGVHRPVAPKARVARVPGSDPRP